MEFKKLYKVDSTGNMRVWHMEQDENKYRVHSGVLGGKIVISGWKTAEAKNVGRANATTDVEQAKAEIDAKYEFQLFQSCYYETQELAREAKPQFFKVMTAHKYNDHRDKLDFPLYSQPKLDGIRCAAMKHEMQSRGGKPILGVPHIHESLQFIFDLHPDIIIDGELYNHELRDDFNKIQSLVTKKKPTLEELEESEKLAEFHVYDIGIGGSFEERFANNEEIIGALIQLPYIKIVDTMKCENQEQLDNEYGRYLEEGYEGQMVRVPDSPYKKSRSRELLKRKEFVDEEFKIVSIEEGKGNWAGRAKAVYIKLKDGTTQKAGLRGDFEFTKMLLQEKDEYVGGEVTVRYQNKTPDGKLRFPVAVAFYDEGRAY